MNKISFQKLFMILLPVMAVVLATTGDSVTVFDKATSTTVYGSYFDLIPEAGNCNILPPLAAILAVASVALAILYVAFDKSGCINALRWTSSISASAAALPVAIQGDILVVPHVLFTILMAALFLLTSPFGKKVEQKEDKKKGIRLEKR